MSVSGLWKLVWELVVKYKQKLTVDREKLNWSGKRLGKRRIKNM